MQREIEGTITSITFNDRVLSDEEIRWCLDNGPESLILDGFVWRIDYGY